jgi:hypothetical protein
VLPVECGIGSSSFHLMKLRLFISNDKRPEFKVGTSNGAYEMILDISFKNLNNMKSYTLLVILTLNLDHQINI